MVSKNTKSETPAKSVASKQTAGAVVTPVTPVAAVEPEKKTKKSKKKCATNSFERHKKNRNILPANLRSSAREFCNSRL